MAKDDDKSSLNIEEQIEEDQPSSSDKTEEPKHESSNKFKRLWCWAVCHKKVSVPLAVVIVVGLLAAIPFTRYALAGTVLKQQVSFIVLDDQTNKPVSSASVKVAGKTVSTNGEGKATAKVPVGKKHVEVSKKYYKTTSKDVLVPIMKQKQPETIRVTATGRQVTITVIDKVSKKPISGVTIKAASTEAKTDKDGKAELVLPADKATVEVSLKADGFNELKNTIQVSGQTLAATNSYELTPSGKIYFLSNQAGKIDVVKTDLDGTNRQVVLAGTGNEEKQNTVLLASRDWKYLALQSKRDGGEYAKLFLIDTVTDKVTVMDEGDARFIIVGWSGHRFVYRVDRVKLQPWVPKREALKSYNAPTQKIAVLDETLGESDQFSWAQEFFTGQVYAIDDQVLYGKGWQSTYVNFGTTRLTGKNATFNSVKVDGTNKKVVKNYPVPGTNQTYIGLTLRAYKPGEIYIKNTLDEDKTDEYENGQVKAVTVTSESFYEDYPTYLQSPAGSRTFWSESRDGKNALFIGTKEGGDSKQIASLSEYQTYGWFSDNYLLVTKKGSELYIMPAAGGDPLKISDYYKPAATFRGYGGGYGGL